MTSPRINRLLRSSISLGLAAFVLVAAAPIVRSEPQRRIAAGENAPAFTAIDAAGDEFRFAPGEGRPLLVAFLSSTQPRSVDAWQDLTRIMSKLPPEKVAVLRAALVFTDATNGLFVKLSKDAGHRPFAVIADEKYRVWGSFGVIATPTVVVADANGKVLIVKPGYSYDFEPVVEAYLEKALGLRSEVDMGQVGKVAALDNNSASARAQRHERMADILLEKGQDELAVQELYKAMEIDPNSFSTAIRLAEMLCIAGKPDEALAAVRRWQDTSRLQPKSQAAVLRIHGWAYRQKGQVAEAARVLETARRLDPKSPRTLFELAEVAREQNITDQALELYREAARLLLAQCRGL